MSAKPNPFWVARIAAGGAPRLRNPGESLEDYRVAMGWSQPRSAQPVLTRLRNLRVLLGIDSPETRGWAPAVQQAARRTIDAAIAALHSDGNDRTEPQWGPILDALEGLPNDLRPEFAALDRLIRREHERTLDRIDAARAPGVPGTAANELAAWHAEADRLKKCVDYAPTGMDAHAFRLQLAAHLHTKPTSGVAPADICPSMSCMLPRGHDGLCSVMGAPGVSASDGQTFCGQPPMNAARDEAPRNGHS